MTLEPNGGHLGERTRFQVQMGFFVLVLENDGSESLKNQFVHLVVSLQVSIALW